MQKVRCHFLSFNRLSALNFKIFSLSQSLFHFSLTVLLHYQSLKFLDFEGGPPSFKQNTTCIVLLFIKNFNLYFTGLSFITGNLLWLLSIEYILKSLKSIYCIRSPLITVSRLILFLVT